MRELPIETKDVINDIIKEFVKVIDISAASGVVQRVLKDSYNKGLDELGLQLSMNFTGDPKRLEFLQSYTFENIKDLSEEVAGKLRKELSQGLMNMESIPELAKRVEDVMGVAKTRATMIARTEANRAESFGHYDAAKQSGLKLVKEWDAHLDSRTSPMCRFLNGKRVGMDEYFVYKGEKFFNTPGHVNCRSTIKYVQVDEVMTNE